MKHIISAKNFSKQEVEKILCMAEEMEKDCKSGKVQKKLEDKIIACIFFEPSTRTRLSFETAGLKLGAKIISAENASVNSSAFKGETIEDTTKIICGYADALIIRHPEKGSAEKAVSVATKPILNAGDGAGEHPSQAFLDLYTIKKEHGRLENLHIAFGGDLKHSRTLHSLVPFLKMYKGNVFYFVSPEELSLPKEYTENLEKEGVNFKVMRSLEEALPYLDVLYMTRVQKERFGNKADYEKVKNLFILKEKDLNLLKDTAIIMHPLPKVNEIECGVDNDKRAAYFRQAENGLYIRMALLSYIFE